MRMMLGLRENASNRKNVLDCLAEIAKPKMTFATDVSSPWMDPLRTRLKRVTAWVMRFLAKLLVKVRKVEKPWGVEVSTEVTLTLTELDRAGNIWVKQAQLERFPKEMQELKSGKEVSKQSHLKALTPVVDEFCVLQVGD